MDVNPQVTVLGYKFNRDPHCTKYTPLTDEEDLHAAMACGVELIRQARTRRVVLEIENLVCLLFIDGRLSKLMLCIATGLPGGDGFNKSEASG